MDAKISNQAELLALIEATQVFVQDLQRLAVVETEITPKPSTVADLAPASPVAGDDGLLQSVRQELGDCQRCKLHTGRTNLVFGAGHPQASLVFVGEAPGRDEDRQGQPFVGRAGQLLTKMIEAIGLSRDQVYICNVIKCRPPQNRNPEPDEIASCQPFLRKQLQSIQPKVICALGKFAVQTLLQTDKPISQLRGVFTKYEGILLMPTYHPAYLLRNPAAKKDVWEDMKKIHAELCRLTGQDLVLKRA